MEIWMANLEIDYSGIAQPASQAAQEDWEPPVHKYFGKKLPNGKTEKEPVYSYQEYPRMMYGMRDGKIRAAIVNSDAERAALGENWATTPAAFGHYTAPSFEQVQEMRLAKEQAATASAGDAEPVAEAPRRGPGRPKAA
jgi:hypothetical protein